MRFLLVAVAALIALSTGHSVAQPYPNRPIKIVVPFAPGAGVDLVARVLASRLEAQFGQSVIVENRTGAGAMTGTAVVATSPADGYTFLVVDPSVTAIPTLQPDSSYQLKQLKAVATLTAAPLMVVVPPSLPVNNLRELIEYSKSRPEGISFGSAGIGTTLHLAPELLKFRHGFNATHVPYKGGAPALVDLLGGRLQAMFSTASNVLPSINDGKLRAIAQTGTARVAYKPDVPTAVESGYPDFVVQFWIGLFAPAALPADIENRVKEEVKKAVESKEFIAATEKAGLDVFFKDGKAAQDFVDSEAERWGNLIKSARITPN